METQRRGWFGIGATSLLAAGGEFADAGMRGAACAAAMGSYSTIAPIAATVAALNMFTMMKGDTFALRLPCPMVVWATMSCWMAMQSSVAGGDMQRQASNETVVRNGDWNPNQTIRTWNMVCVVSAVLAGAVLTSVNTRHATRRAAVVLHVLRAGKSAFYANAAGYFLPLAGGDAFVRLSIIYTCVAVGARIIRKKCAESQRAWRGDACWYILRATMVAVTATTTTVFTAVPQQLQPVEQTTASANTIDIIISAAILAMIVVLVTAVSELEVENAEKRAKNATVGRKQVNTEHAALLSADISINAEETEATGAASAVFTWDDAPPPPTQLPHNPWLLLLASRSVKPSAIACLAAVCGRTAVPIGRVTLPNKWRIEDSHSRCLRHLPHHHPPATACTPPTSQQAATGTALFCVVVLTLSYATLAILAAEGGGGVVAQTVGQFLPSSRTAARWARICAHCFFCCKSASEAVSTAALCVSVQTRGRVATVATEAVFAFAVVFSMCGHRPVAAATCIATIALASDWRQTRTTTRAAATIAARCETHTLLRPRRDEVLLRDMHANGAFCYKVHCWANGGAADAVHIVEVFALSKSGGIGNRDDTNTRSARMCKEARVATAARAEFNRVFGVEEFRSTGNTTLVLSLPRNPPPGIIRDLRLASYDTPGLRVVCPGEVGMYDTAELAIVAEENLWLSTVLDCNFDRRLDDDDDVVNAFEDLEHMTGGRPRVFVRGQTMVLHKEVALVQSGFVRIGGFVLGRGAAVGVACSADRAAIQNGARADVPSPIYSNVVVCVSSTASLRVIDEEIADTRQNAAVPWAVVYSPDSSTVGAPRQTPWPRGIEL